MAWNEPGRGNDRDPWRGNRNDGRDADDALKDLFNRLGGLFGGGGPRDSRNDGGGLVLAVVAAIAVTVWGISGFYTVKEAEQAVVLRFGEFNRIVGSGLKWRPTFVENHRLIDVNNVKSLPSRGSMLTKDENLVEVELVVQYRVTDPRAYLFNAVNPEDSLSQSLDSALRYVVGHSSMDDVLTSGRSKMRLDVWNELERIIEPYAIGLEVREIAIQDVRPPAQVRAAFDDAVAAREDEERLKQEAEAYAAEREPRARGQAKRLLEEAEAYRERVILEARGEVARFEKLLPEFKQAPQVTRDRLYLEAMEQVLSGSRTVIVDQSGGNQGLYVLPLDKIMGERDSAPRSLPSEPREAERNSNNNSSSSTDAAAAANWSRDSGRNSVRHGRGE